MPQKVEKAFKVPLWAYLIYGIVKLLNCIDWILLALFGKRLQRIDLKSFVNSLNAEEQLELKNPDILEPLALQIQGLQNDKCLSAFVRFVHVMGLKRSIQKRVAHKAAIVANPDVLKTPIRRPIFLIGLPRSGTTFLQGLLSQDPSIRSPMLWELMEPLPLNGPIVDWQNDPRYLNTCKALDYFRFITGINFDCKHYVRPDIPYECWVPMQLSFYTNPTLQVLPPLRQYCNWHFTRDLASKNRLYAFYKQQLQLLCYGRGMDEKHIQAKSFLHLLNLEALLKTFPDACLVFTYRKLHDVIPSLTSLLSSFTFGSMDPDFGPRILEMMSKVLNTAAGNLQKVLQGENGKKTVLFLNYEDFMKDKTGTVLKIYDHFGLKAETGLKEKFDNYVEANPQHQHGKHRYNMDEYGITSDDIETSCQQYINFMKQFTDEVV